MPEWLNEADEILSVVVPMGTLVVGMIVGYVRLQNQVKQNAQSILEFKQIIERRFDHIDTHMQTIADRLQQNCNITHEIKGKLDAHLEQKRR